MRQVIILMAAFLFLPAAQAEWRLLDTASHVSIGTTKNGSVEETHQFKILRGSVQDSGAVLIEIDLLSIDTQIELRDQRMRDTLFADFSNAVYEVNLVLAEIENLASGGSIDVALEGSLSLNNDTFPLPLMARVTKLESGAYRVTSSGDDELDVADYGYASGIEALRAVANLKSISTQVGFGFELVFEQVETEQIEE